MADQRVDVVFTGKQLGRVLVKTLEVFIALLGYAQQENNLDIMSVPRNRFIKDSDAYERLIRHRLKGMRNGHAISERCLSQ